MIELIQISVDGLVVGAVYALVAVGFSIIFRVTGVINLAQGGFVGLGALSGYTMTQTLGLPAIVGLPLAVVATALFGLVIGSVTFVPALRKLSNSNILMITVGILTMIEGLSFLLWQGNRFWN